MSQAQTESTRPQVEYRRLGNSGLRVSVPILGAGSIGSSKHMSILLDEDKAFPLLKAAWDRGVTTIDTANTYSNGESERVIGRFLKQYNIPRHRVVLLTKCHWPVHEDVSVHAYLTPEIKDTRDYVNQSGLSRAAIFNQVDASLERLQTSYIDLYQIHRLDFDTPMEEIMRALHDLVQSGKVRYIGASSMRCWQFVEMNAIAEKHGWTKFISMQNEYSLLYREEEREMIPYCISHGIGLIPWSPLQGGDLAHAPDASTARKELMKGTPFERKHSDADLTIIARVQEIAKKRGWSMSEVALAWIDKKVSSPIVGCTSPERLESAIVRGKELTSEEVKYLEEPYVPKAVRGHL